MAGNLRIHRTPIIQAFFQVGHEFIHNGSGEPISEYDLYQIEELVKKTRALLDDPNRLDLVCKEAREAKAEMYASAITEPEYKEQRSCYVYLMYDTMRRVYKIGQSNNPNKRLKQIKTANAGVKMICSYSAEPIDEFNMHSKFAVRRISGEWFDLSPEDLNAFHAYFISLGSERTDYPYNI